MTKTLLAGLLLLLPLSARAQLGCSLTTGSSLVLEKPRPALTALSEAVRCQNRNWDILVASVAFAGSSPTFAQVWVDTLTARGARLYLSSYTLVGSSVYVMGHAQFGSSATFANGAGIGGAVTFNGSSVTVRGEVLSSTLTAHAAYILNAATFGSSMTVVGSAQFNGNIGMSAGYYLYWADTDASIHRSGTNLRIDGPTGGTIRLNADNRDVDFQMEGDTNDGFFFLDGGTEMVGIGTVSPLAKLSVVGDSSFSQPATFLSSVTAVGNLSAASLGVGANDYALTITKSAGDWAGLIRNSNAVGRGLNVDLSGGSTGIALGVTAGATQILNALGSGSVGIGTASPGATLHVSSGAGISMLIDGNAPTPFAIGSTVSINSNGYLVLGQEPTVGAGIQLPFGGASEVSFFYNSTNKSGIKHAGSSRTTVIYTDYSDDDGALAFNVASDDEAMRITKDKSVGIGTASPASKLDVQGAAQFGTTTASTFSATGNLTLGANRILIANPSYGEFYCSGSACYIGNINVNGGFRMIAGNADVIAASLNQEVGINDTSPDARFDVKGGAMDQYHVHVTSADDSTREFSVDKYGFVGSTTHPAARWTRTTALSIANDTNTMLKFTVKEYDSRNNMFAVTTATIPAGGDGTYDVRVYAAFANDGSPSGRRNLTVLKNGAAITGCNDSEAALSGDETRVNVDCAPYLQAGDAITVQAYQNDGTALDVNSASIEVAKRLY